ncbi:MAG: LLM class flavin-dependent oxidoreductase, partial [Blastocatellia bacterium]
QKPRPPIMIGGAGEQMTMKVVAKHADIWNTFGPPSVFRHKIEVLKSHCGAVGRNVDDIEISWAGATHITDSAEEARAIAGRIAAAFGRPVEEVEAGLFVGSPQDIRGKVEGLLEAGVTHFIIIPVGPNLDTVRRFYEEVAAPFRG